MTNLIFLCTGNAARSVIATVIALHRMPALGVRGAGTFSIPGLPMSERTRQALAHLGYSDPSHRSHQLEQSDADWADLIVGFEPDHVEYVRRKHPEAAGVTSTLGRLARDLKPSESLGAQLDALQLATLAVQPWEEVVDPAGGDQAVFHACAAEISGLLDRLLPALDGLSS